MSAPRGLFTEATNGVGDTGPEKTMSPRAGAVQRTIGEPGSLGENSRSSVLTTGLVPRPGTVWVDPRIRFQGVSEPPTPMDTPWGPPPSPLDALGHGVLTPSGLKWCPPPPPRTESRDFRELLAIHQKAQADRDAMVTGETETVVREEDDVVFVEETNVNDPDVIEVIEVKDTAETGRGTLKRRYPMRVRRAPKRLVLDEKVVDDYPADSSDDTDAETDDTVSVLSDTCRTDDDISSVSSCGSFITDGSGSEESEDSVSDETDDSDFESDELTSESESESEEEDSDEEDSESESEAEEE
ncbi:ORF21 [Ictalurid herpesvirus 1]|nr:ORF21 [Ictalurid herpesvirus 1]